MKMLGLEKLLNNSPWSRKRVLKLAKELLKLVQIADKSDLLEIGCGTGAVSKYIAETYDGNIIGLDIDDKQIQENLKKIKNRPNLKFIVADALELPFEDNSFDVVLSFGVLHHIDGWQKALAEVNRVLRPGGYFIGAEVIYPEAISSMDKESSYSFGLESVDIDEIEGFFTDNNFTEIYSAANNLLVCQNYEAVYQKAV
ncbi:MAG: class I SAM-dependent methyltransferase [Dehalococcoidales bacterium]